MRRTNEAKSMLRYSTALILSALMLTGCNSIQHRISTKQLERETGVVYKTVERLVEVEKFVEIPTAMLARCPVAHTEDSSVGEYVRVAVVNTPALETCAKQIEDIRALQLKQIKK